jgi:hypothetical protein
MLSKVVRYRYRRRSLSTIFGNTQKIAARKGRVFSRAKVERPVPMEAKDNSDECSIEY